MAIDKHDREETETKGRHKPAPVQALLSSEDVVERQVSGFMGFLRERTVVTIAVSFVVATQVQSLVNQLIASFLDPMTTLLFGAKLSSVKFTLHYHDRSADFAWGAFIYELIDFFVVIIAIYVIIKILKLDKFEKRPEPKR